MPDLTPDELTRSILMRLTAREYERNLLVAEAARVGALVFERGQENARLRAALSQVAASASVLAHAYDHDTRPPHGALAVGRAMPVNTDDIDAIFAAIKPVATKETIR